MATLDLTGQRFHKLTALYPTGKKSEHGSNAIWVCLCDCGKYTEANTGQLRCGTKKSCGCAKAEHASSLNRTHGGRNDRLYLVWMDMRRRCRDTKDRNYKNYGGRGISVCSEWDAHYELFKEWALSNGYDETAKKSKCTLDRINVDGNYCPENCRWVDVITQCNNKRNNRRITYGGETHTMAEWDRARGFPKNTIYKRISAGWTAEKAITKHLDYTHHHKMRMDTNGKPL